MIGLFVGPVELQRPLVLLAIPVAIAVLAGLLFVRTGARRPSRGRLALFVSRGLIIALVLLAVAGPYIVSVSATPEDPSVHLVVDDSESMDVYDVNPAAVADRIEAQGVPVTTTTIGSDRSSPLGDQLLPLVGEGEHLLVLSDGQVTDGRNLGSVVSAAETQNATISAVDLSPTRTERHVSVSAPKTTSVGAEEELRVSVGGVGETSTSVTVAVDGEPIHTERVSGQQTLTVSHTFESVGDRRVTAQIDGPGFERNRLSRASVRVIEPPDVLYVARADYPLGSYLGDIYDVTQVESIPDRDRLAEYHAVVIQDVAAGDLGNVGALQSYAADGNGVVSVGGKNAYEQGGYQSSAIGTLLPVRFQNQAGSRDIILAVDVSGDAARRMPRIRGQAIDIVDQLGDTHNVGLVAFDSEAETLVPLGSLGRTEEEIKATLRRLEAGDYANNIASGLEAAGEELPDGGELILLSEGVGTHSEPLSVAEQLADQNVRITGVGTGRWRDDSLMTKLARTTGGTYIQADQRDRLQLLFSEASALQADRLVRTDTTSFITRNVEPTANPDRAHSISAKPGARVLVTTAEGTPAVTTWRFGLGRVASVTVYDDDGSLGGLLVQPDAAMTTKTVNWAIGNPLRTQTGIIDLPDTRVGASTTAVYRGTERPAAADVRFVSAGETRYEARVTPDESGFHSVLDTEYAADYPAEFAAFGQHEALGAAVEQTGGQLFAPGEAGAMAEFVRSAPVQERTIQRDLSWLPLALGLIVFLLEVAARRLDRFPTIGQPNQPATPRGGDE